jgi:hypothetical protein
MDVDTFARNQLGQRIDLLLDAFRQLCIHVYQPP